MEQKLTLNVFLANNNNEKKIKEQNRIIIKYIVQALILFNVISSVNSLSSGVFVKYCQNKSSRII